MFSSEESKGEGNGELCDLTKRIGDLVFGASVEAPPTQVSQVLNIQTVSVTFKPLTIRTFSIKFGFRWTEKIHARIGGEKSILHALYSMKRNGYLFVR